MRIYDTINTMLGADPEVDDYSVALGRDTTDDGGGGLFYWDANAAEPADGGTIFLSSLTEKTGRWKRICDNQILNVRWFGAKGTGISKDHDGVQSAINAALPKSSVDRFRSVYFPQGWYTIETPLIIENTDLNIPIHLTLEGEGENSILQGSQDILAKFIRSDAQHSNMLSLKNLRFHVLTVDTSCIRVETLKEQTSHRVGSDLKVSDCYFTGWGHGITLIGAREPQITSSRFELRQNLIQLKKTANPKIDGCLFTTFSPGTQEREFIACGINYIGAGTSWDAGLTVTNCTFMGLSHGILANDTDYINISSCMLDACTSPIELIQPDTAIIQGNWIGAGSPYQPGPLTAIKIYGTPNTYGRHIKIINNDIVTYTDIGTSRTGIYVRYLYNLKIHGNTIQFYNDYGIDNNSSDPFCNQLVSIENNTILTSPPSGVTVARPTSGTAIIPAGQSSTTLRHGIGTYPSKVFLSAGGNTACFPSFRDADILNISIPKTLTADMEISWRLEV